MDKATDIENLRPLLEKVLLSFQLTPEKVKVEGSNIEVFDRGRFTCPLCIDRTTGRSYAWHSAYSWLTFDLRELIVKKKWKMKCIHCLTECKPYFTPEQLESMFKKAVRCYKGEKFKPDINIGYGARRIYRQPHHPELCEKCDWGATCCWRRY